METHDGSRDFMVCRTDGSDDVEYLGRNEENHKLTQQCHF